MITNLSKKVNKIFTFVLIIIVIFTVAFSEYYICKEIFHQHECHDEDCPICSVISQSNNLISNLLLVESNDITTFVWQNFIEITKDDYVLFYNSTLVSDNVRLNE